MLRGKVGSDGVPIITLPLRGDLWTAIIDTGFNGDVELPLGLREALHARRTGLVTSLLAGGQRIEEERYLLDFPFDGEIMLAAATFVAGQEILIGTHLLRRHRLEINFATRDVLIERVT